MPYDIIEEAAPASGGFEILDEQETPGELSGIVNSYRRGNLAAQRAIEAVQMTPERGPTLRQERRGFVQAMEDPEYLNRLMAAGDDPAAMRRVESLYGPGRRVEAMTDPQRQANIATAGAIADLSKRADAIPQSAAMQEWAKANNSNWWQVFARNPVEITANIFAESLPQAAPTMAATMATGGMGRIASATAGGAGSFGIEAANSLIDAAASQGVDLHDPEQVRAFFSDENKVKAARDFAMQRGLPIGLLDALTVGVAGKFLKPALGKGVARVAGATAAEAGAQMAGGAGGEALAQVASGQDLSLRDIAAEAIGELATAPGEVISNLREEMRNGGGKGRGFEVIEDKPKPVGPTVDDLKALQAAMRGNQLKPVETKPAADPALDEVVTALRGENPEAPRLKGALKPVQPEKAGDITEAGGQTIVVERPAELTEEQRAAIEQVKRQDAEVAKFVENPDKNYEGMGRLELELLEGMGDARATAALRRMRARKFANVESPGANVESPAANVGSLVADIKVKPPVDLPGSITEPEAVAAAGKTVLTGESFRKRLNELNGNMPQADLELVATPVQAAIGNGQRVTLIADGKPIPIVAVANGMLEDEKGQRWGTFGIATDKSGNWRLEIDGPQTPAPITANLEPAPLQPPTVSAPTTELPQISSKVVEPKPETDAARVRREAKEFDKLLLDYGMEAGWVRAPEVLYDETASVQTGHGTASIKAKILRSKEMAGVRRRAAQEMGAQDFADMGDAKRRAALLPKLRELVEQRFAGPRRQAEEFGKATVAGKVPVPIGELKVGDTLNIEGDVVRVVEVSPDGEVTLQDGTRFGRQVMQDGSTIYAEEWQSEPADTGAGFEAVEEPAQPAVKESLTVEQKATEEAKAQQTVLPKYKLSKPIVGTTGAKIVGYEWRSMLGEKWSEREGGYIEARVSDWDNADQSKGTGRQIVHVYFVEHPDGRITTEGIRSAQNVLGISESRLQTIAKKAQAEQAYAAEQERLHFQGMESTAENSPAEASKKYRKANWSPLRSFEENEEVFNRSKLFEKGGRFVRTSTQAERMIAQGWKPYNPLEPATVQHVTPPPQLKSGQAQGDLLGSGDVEFNLYGERTGDGDKVTAAMQAEEETKRAAKEFEAKNQMELPEIVYTARTLGGQSRYVYMMIDGQPWAVRISNHSRGQVRGGDWKSGFAALKKRSGAEYPHELDLRISQPDDVTVEEIVNEARRVRADYVDDIEPGDISETIDPYKRKTTESEASRTITDSPKSAANQIQTESQMVSGTQSKPESADPVNSTNDVQPADRMEEALNKAIAATDFKPGQLLEGVTGAPVWLTRAAANGALRIVRAAYRGAKSLANAIGEALDYLRGLNLEGYDDAEARAWLENKFQPGVRDELERLQTDMDAMRARGEEIPQAMLDQYKELADTLAEEIRSGRETTGQGRIRVDENLKENPQRRAAGEAAYQIPQWRGEERLPKGRLRDLLGGLKSWRAQAGNWLARRQERMDVTIGRDAADNRAAQSANEASLHVRLALNRAFDTAPGEVRTKHETREAALTFVVEADGDRAKLAEFHEQIATSEFSETKAARQAMAAIEYAEAHWEKLQQAAERYRVISEAERETELNEGVNSAEWRGGYVYHRWAKESPAGGADPTQATPAGTPFRKSRSVATYAEGIAAGRKPQTLNALELLAERVAAGQRRLNELSWVHGLRNMIDPVTDMPVVVDVIKKPRRPVNLPAPGSPAAQAMEAAGETYKPEWQTIAPEGYKLWRLGDLEVAVQENFAGLLTKLTEPSFFNAGVKKAFGWLKSALLMFDTFHLGRMVAWRQMFGLFGGYQKGQTLLDFSTADIREMAARGEIPEAWADGLIENKRRLNLAIRTGFNIGNVLDNSWGDALHNLPGIGTFNKWLFGQYQRGAMAEAWLIEFERMSRALPNVPEAKVARRVSANLNARFGNLNRQGLFKSRTAQDWARFVFLAPQWNESLIRSELGAIGQAVMAPIESVQQRRLVYGTLLRATGLMAVGTFLANQILNFAFRGKPTWDNDEEEWDKKISAYIPDAIGGGPGFFLNPLALPMEYTHLIEGNLHRSGGDMSEALRRVLVSRLHAGARPVEIFLNRKDPLGRKLRDGEVLPAMAKALIPAPIASGTIAAAGKQLVTGEPSEQFPGQYQKQLMASFGVKTDQAPSPEQRIRNLAREFNKAKGIEPSAEFYAGDYDELNKALRIGNEIDARAAFDELLKKRTPREVYDHYKRAAVAPFTGQKGREKEFWRGLTPKQREVYEQARAARRDTSLRAVELLREVMATPAR